MTGKTAPSKTKMKNLASNRLRKLGRIITQYDRKAKQFIVYVLRLMNWSSDVDVL